MSIISEFVQDFRSRQEEFQRLTETCAGLLDSGLNHAGLRGIVTSRVKRTDRLLEKVTERDQTKHYQSTAAIYDDIPDLAGVRVALYFPGDRDEVDAFIRDKTVVEEARDFPRGNPRTTYPRRFSGYTARHYRVRLRPEELQEQNQHLIRQVIEIQVASVLMHAWSEVEHDLVYKPRSGSLSLDEYAILDELNGLVHAGEIALERLQAAVSRRVTNEAEPFHSHYELSAFLYDQAKRRLPAENEPAIGRADVLHRFLTLTGFNTPHRLSPVLESLQDDAVSHSVTQGVADRILADHPHLYHLYNTARLEIGQVDPYSRPDESVSFFSEERALGFFMQNWIAVEAVIREVLGRSDYTTDFLQQPLAETVSEPVLDEKSFRRLDSIRQLRNQVVHGIRFPSERQLVEAGHFLRRILQEVSQKRPDLRGIEERPKEGPTENTRL